MQQYCCDFYRSVLWDLSHPSVDDVCTARRKGTRRAWGLPSRTHCDLLAPVSRALPLLDELVSRSVRFLVNCLNSDNNIVKFTAAYGIYYARIYSPLGRNAQFCCSIDIINNC